MAEPHRLIPNARHEHTDVGEKFIWGAAALMLGVLVLCAVLIVWLYPRTLSDVTLTLPLPIYPAPRLQPNPVADMQAFRVRQLQQLNDTGWVDESHGVAHIPIDDAMRRVAHDGIPGWPASASAAPPAGSSASSDDRP